MGLRQKHNHNKNMGFGELNVSYQIGRKISSLPRMVINRDILIYINVFKEYSMKEKTTKKEKYC